MSELLLDVKLGVPEVECPAGVADQWQESFKLNAQRINKKRLARVGTPESFSSVLAGPAAQGYKGYLDPTFTTRKGRTGAQAEANQEIGVKGSFDKFNSKTRRAFDIPAGSLQSRFADSVDQAKKSFSQGNAGRTLRITGSGHGGLGIAGIAGMFLTRGRQAEAYLRGCDNLLAGSAVMFPVGLNSRAFKAALSGVLTYTGVEWIKNDFSVEAAGSLNSMLAGLLAPLVDDSALDAPVDVYDPVHSFIGWERDPVLGPVFHVRIWSTYGPPPPPPPVLLLRNGIQYVPFSATEFFPYYAVGDLGYCDYEAGVLRFKETLLDDWFYLSGEDYQREAPHHSKTIELELKYNGPNSPGQSFEDGYGAFFLDDFQMSAGEPATVWQVLFYFTPTRVYIQGIYDDPFLPPWYFEINNLVWHKFKIVHWRNNIKVYVDDGVVPVFDGDVGASEMAGALVGVEFGVMGNFKCPLGVSIKNLFWNSVPV